MSITDRIPEKDKGKRVLVQCFMSRELSDRVKEKLSLMEKKVTISEVIRASFEEFLIEDEPKALKKIIKKCN